MLGRLKELLFAAPAVVTMLILQVVVLSVSLGGFYEISVFCTGPTSSWLSGAFGLLHLSFLVLLALGMASLAWPAARPAYLLMIVAGLALLPIQATLVRSHNLTCDFP